jgi:alpha-tubulin suppressor-like RCC1 family protein
MNNSLTPPVSDVLGGAQAVTAGYYHTCALLTSGNVRCWGSDSYGQLGDGNSMSFQVNPTSVATVSGELGGVQAIAAGAHHTCALLNTSAVRCWGYNIYGQLGDGTTTNRSNPPDTDVLTGAQAIAAGFYHSCALMKTGSVRCWGYNYDGQLGDGPMSYRTAPAPVVCR